MTGNGKHTTYQNGEIGLVYDWYTHIIPLATKGSEKIHLSKDVRSLKLPALVPFWLFLQVLPPYLVAKNICCPNHFLARKTL